jgi:hypothetical protein
MRRTESAGDPIRPIGTSRHWIAFATLLLATACLRFVEQPSADTESHVARSPQEEERQRAVQACKAAAWTLPTRSGRGTDALSGVYKCDLDPYWIVRENSSNGSSAPAPPAQLPFQPAPLACAYANNGFQKGCYATMQACQMAIQPQFGDTCQFR